MGKTVRNIPSFPSAETVKEPHFLDFRQRKINSLRVKNHPFLEFFYSFDTWERVKYLEAEHKKSRDLKCLGFFYVLTYLIN